MSLFNINYVKLVVVSWAIVHGQSCSSSRNLPAAIGSYYDNEQPSNFRVPSMAFIKDITIGEGEAVPTNTDFIKTWRIQNTGE